MKAPVTYQPGFLQPDEADRSFHRLWNELAWIRHAGAPRREYYVARDGQPYTYGRGSGVRTYQAQMCHTFISAIWGLANSAAGVEFDVCFLNGYEDERDQLGWHADDSPEMDDARPIAIVSLGAEREIMFRPRPEALVATGGVARGEVFAVLGQPLESLLLQHGSLCLMAPGMQDTHQHKIPKAGRKLGPRISLTFRGVVR